MPLIVRMQEISSIKVGPGSTVLPDGTILNPAPYGAVNIWFDDGAWVQIERPLTVAKVQAAHRAAKQAQNYSYDGIATGQPIPP